MREREREIERATQKVWWKGERTTAAAYFAFDYQFQTDCRLKATAQESSKDEK